MLSTNVQYVSLSNENSSMLESKTASSVIIHLKSLFARYGIPEVLMSDNMPFNSKAFHEFATEWNYDLVTSSPRYPQSNGMKASSANCQNAAQESESRWEGPIHRSATIPLCSNLGIYTAVNEQTAKGKTSNVFRVIEAGCG